MLGIFQEKKNYIYIYIYIYITKRARKLKLLAFSLIQETGK